LSAWLSPLTCEGGSCFDVQLDERDEFNARDAVEGSGMLQQAQQEQIGGDHAD
jgi:hypothetical protein